MSLNAPFVATNTAPTGAENTGVVRSIARKNTVIETTTPIGANAVFVGPWRDTQADGTVQVCLTSFSNQASAASGLVIQETEDVGNANFIRSVQFTTASASTLTRIFATIRARYWRAQYTNGAAAQGSFELSSSSTNAAVLSNAGDFGGAASNLPGPVVGIFSPSSNATIGDNNTSSNVTNFQNIQQGNPLEAFVPVYGGSFSGTASATKQGWSRPRTPTVFNTTQATASGNTAVWTPATSNKFRLLKYQVEVTANAAISGGAVVLTVGFQDATTDLNLTHDVWVPATSVTTNPGDGYISGWQDLGQFGILSAAAGNVLNVHLSSTLTSGNVRVRVAGTEE